MTIRQIGALAAFIVACQLLHAAPASAASLERDRQSTLLVARLLGDAKAARLALTRNDTTAASRDIDSALAVHGHLVRLAGTNGTSMIVPIYTELDDAPALSDDWIVPNQARDTSTADREKSLEITYFAIDLNKAKARLDSAKVAVRDRNDQSAENSLVGIRSDLIAINHVADAPLLQARRDLALADRDIASKDMSAASRHLEKATASLKTYSSVGHTAAARQLAADIRTAMPPPTDNGAVISKRIDRWWGSLKSWFSQHT